MGNIFHLHLWHLIVHPWTWHLSAFSFSNSWVFTLPSSLSTFVSQLTPLSQIKECIIISLHCIWSLPRWFKCFWVIFRVIPCSRETSSAVYLYSCLTFLWVVHILISPMVVLITSTLSFVPCFVSMMRESSWPSFDDSIPIDIKTSSEN